MKAGYIFICFIFGHIGCNIISTRCPTHWLERPEGNSCYRFWLTHVKTWDEAREQCKKSNGDLLKLDTKQEKEWILQVIEQYPSHYEWWIGLHRQKGNDSVWVWTDGTKSNETIHLVPWRLGKPSNRQNSGDCASIWNNVLVNDNQCEEYRSSICERQKDLPLNCDVDDGWAEFFTQSDYCYKYVDEKMTFTEASTKCQSENSRLAAFDQEEYQSLLTDLLFHKNRTTVWLGWQYNTTDDKWEDSASVYTQEWWHGGTPDNTTLADDNTLCSVIDSNIPGKKNWRPANCNSENTVICLKNKGLCPEGFVKHKNKCYLLNMQDSFTWNEARGYCNLWQTTLLEVKNDNDYFYTLSLIKNHFSITGKTSVWQGLSGQNVDSNLKWDSGAEIEKYVITKSNDTFDSTLAGTQCGFIENILPETDDKSHWKFGDCGESRGTICTVDVGGKVNPPPPHRPRYECPEGYTLHGVICYHWNPEDPVDWYTAREKCARDGADLVTIQSDEEHEFISSHIESECWIGLNDRRSEGDYKWLDSTAKLTITNWFEEQPNNAVIGGAYSENCVSMLYLPGTENHGQWVDNPCSHKARFMCQMPAEWNIALGKVASMSSLHQIMAATEAEFNHILSHFSKISSETPTLYVKMKNSENTADKAVDGCSTRSMQTDTCCAKTDDEADKYPWWQLDLGTIYPIGKVVIYRQFEKKCGQCKTQFQNFRLFISNSSNVGDSDEADLVYQEKRENVPAVIVLNLQNVTVGRYVRIDIPRYTAMALCEVKIYQGISLQKPVDPSNSHCVTDSAQWKGDVRHTVSGKTCQAWRRDFPHKHKYHKQTFPDGSDKEAQNFCRDPAGKGSPWCFTEDPNIVWEFCPVPHCTYEVGAIAKINEPNEDKTDCDPGWLKRQGACYWFGEELLTWSDARSVCESVGATLPIPMKTAVVELLTEKLENRKRGGSTMWLGVYNKGDHNGWVSDSTGPSKFDLDQLPDALPSTTTCLTINQAGHIIARDCLERNVYSCVKMGPFIEYITSSDGGFTQLPLNVIKTVHQSSVSTLYSLKFGCKGINGATLKLHGSPSSVDNFYLISIGGNILTKSSILKSNSGKPKYTNLIKNIYNQHDYTSFWIQWTSGNKYGDDIMVGRESEVGRNVFMQWTDPDGIEATQLAIATVMNASTVYKGYWRMPRVIADKKPSSAVNLALRRQAKQSSTFSSFSGADKAVDGCTLQTYSSGCLAHTLREFEPWWEVDLGRVYPIREVVIYRRGPECCVNRLGYFKLIISQLSDSTLDEDVAYQSNESEPPFIMHLSVKGRSGRYVKIVIPGRKRYLELAEVEVYQDLDVSKCGAGWVDNEKDGTCYKFSETKMSWTNAQIFCAGFNAEMVIPQSADEQLFLYEKSLPITDTSLNSNSLWLGLHDRDSEGTFVTTDGSKLTYTDWGINEPNNFGHDEDCGALRIDWSNKTGRWNDENCNAKLRVVCKRNELTTTTTSTTITTTTTTTTMPTTTTTTVTPTRLSQAGCKANWIYSPISSSCLQIFTSEPVSFISAATRCIKMKARLASMANAQEQNLITEMMRMKGISGGRWQGLWLGGTYFAKTPDWEWFMDNTPWKSDYRWTKGHPDNYTLYQHCTVILSEANNFGLLNNAHCKEKLSSIQGYICQYNIKDDTPCDDGWIYNRKTDTCYNCDLTNKASWNVARAKCSQQDGELASIASTSEQLFLTALLDNSNVTVAWMGAQDNTEEDGYQWIDGTTWLGSLWTPDHINDRKSKQTCPVAVTFGSKNVLGLTFQDEFCRSENPYICAIRNCPSGWEKIEKSCYLFSMTNRGWEDAKADCNFKGARLVIVDNESEHGFLRQKVTVSGVDFVWIGARYDPLHGEHRWVDGSSMTFTAWASGLPGKLQGCVAYQNHLGYLWNTKADCVNTKGPYICEKESVFGHGHINHTTTIPGTPASPEKTIQTTASTITRKCGLDWYLDPYSNNCYKFVRELRTWTAAQIKCSEDGGSLASIISDDEQLYIVGRLHDIQLLPEAMWIGATDADFDAGWRWNDDNPFAYLNWAFGKPSSFSADDNDEETNCAAIATYMGQDFGQWTDLSCNSKRGYICKKKVDTGGETTTTLSTSKPIIDSNKYYGCIGTGWLGYKESCYLVVENKTDWNEANSYCKMEGAELASINDEEEQDFVFSQLPHESYCFNVWNDTKCETWAERGECDINPRWMAINCHLACKHCFHNCRDKYQSSSKCLEWTQLGECDKNPSWMIKNCAMSCGVCQGAPTRGYWIGLQSSDIDQKYTWSDLSVVKYTNWDNHQPIWFNLQTGSCVAMFIQNGRWNDGRCEDPLQGFVCKQPKMIVAQTSQSPFQVGCTMDNSIGYGSFCYVYVKQRMNWADAKGNCRSLGGHLTYIGNMITQAFISSELQKLLQDHWIGLSVNSGNWSWDGKDETTLTMTHFDKTVNVDRDDNKGCFAMTSYKPVGLWKLYPDCSLKLPSICQLPRDGFTTTPSTTTAVSTTQPPDCEQGWQPYESYCYKIFTEEQSWYKAKLICTHYGSSLASIHDDKENKAIAAMALIDGEYWIGLHDTRIEGDYVWEDGSPVDFTSFKHLEPNNANGNEHCIELQSYNGRWNDNGCDVGHHFICKIPRGKTVNKDPHTTETFQPCNVDSSDDGWISFGEFCYFLGESDYVTFHDANDKCKEAGSQLASVHSDQENFFLGSLNVKSSGTTWIGLNDLALDDRFSWSDGTVVDYTAWDIGQPDDANGGEKCAFLHRSGRWRDHSCNDLKPYICKRRKDGVTATTSPPTTLPIQGGCPESFTYSLESRCYYFHTKGYTSNWTNAQGHCALLGGRLISIHSQMEQAFISAIVYGSRTALWIGMHDLNKDGSFDWADNSRIDYSNWAFNQPSSNIGTYATDPCVEMWTNRDSLGEWNDVKCYASRGFICSSLKDPSKVPVSNCPEGYIYIRTSCYKVLSSHQSWNRSVELCSSEGAVLLPFTEAPDGSILDFLHLVSGQPEFWIGGTAIQGFITWINGLHSTVPFSNIDAIRTGCLFRSSVPSLATDSCTRSRSAVCTIKTGPTTKTNITPSTDTVPITNKTVPSYICRNSSWFLYDSYCYNIVYESSTFSNTKCSKYGMYLASIHSAAENYKLLSWVLREQHSNGHVIYPYLWIGLVLRSGMTQNQWTDGSSVTYTNIEDRTVPSLGCVRLKLYTGKWQVVSCTDKYFYICKGKADIVRTSFNSTTSIQQDPRDKQTETERTAKASSGFHMQENKVKGSNNNGLTGGEIAGIVIGVICLVLLIGGLVFIVRIWLFRREAAFNDQRTSQTFDNALFYISKDSVSLN